MHLNDYFGGNCNESSNNNGSQVDWLMFDWFWPPKLRLLRPLPTLPLLVELHFDGEIDFPIIVFGETSCAADIAIIHKEEKKRKSSSSTNGFYWNYHRRGRRRRGGGWMRRRMKNKRTMMMLVKGRQRQRRSEIRCRRSFISGGSGWLFSIYLYRIPNTHE